MYPFIQRCMSEIVSSKVLLSGGSFYFQGAFSPLLIKMHCNGLAGRASVKSLFLFFPVAKAEEK